MYCIEKENSFNKTMLLNNSFEGLDITPKNHINYDGIVVSKLIVLDKNLISCILKKKIKRKLEFFLQFIIDYIDDDSDSGTGLREILNDITRYREILNHRYQKYLGEKYIETLQKKLDLLSNELNVKLYIINEKQIAKEDDYTSRKSR